MNPVEVHCRTQRLNFLFFLFLSSLSVQVVMNTGSSSIKGSWRTWKHRQCYCACEFVLVHIYITVSQAKYKRWHWKITSEVKVFCVRDIRCDITAKGKIRRKAASWTSQQVLYVLNLKCIVCCHTHFLFTLIYCICYPPRISLCLFVCLHLFLYNHYLHFKSVGFPFLWCLPCLHHNLNNAEVRSDQQLSHAPAIFPSQMELWITQVKTDEAF